MPPRQHAPRAVFLTEQGGKAQRSAAQRTFTPALAARNWSCTCRTAAAVLPAHLCSERMNCCCATTCRREGHGVGESVHVHICMYVYACMRGRGLYPELHTRMSRWFGGENPNRRAWQVMPRATTLCPRV